MSADSAAAQPATPDSLIEQCLAGDQLAWEQIVRQNWRKVFNVACGWRTTLLEVVEIVGKIVGHEVQPRLSPARSGDIRHSLADITRAREILGYTAPVDFEEGLRRTVAWYRERAKSA